MIFIIRTTPGRVPKLDIKMTRKTPAIVPDSAGRLDYFCRGDPDAAAEGGWPVIPVHDGWYADDRGGGMAIWGQGVFWDVRDTPFTILQASGPDDSPPAAPHAPDTELNVRQTIFRG